MGLEQVKNTGLSHSAWICLKRDHSVLFLCFIFVLDVAFRSPTFILNNAFSKPFHNPSKGFPPISRPIAITLCNIYTYSAVLWQTSGVTGQKEQICMLISYSHSYSFAFVALCLSLQIYSFLYASCVHWAAFTQHNIWPCYVFHLEMSFYKSI